METALTTFGTRDRPSPELLLFRASQMVQYMPTRCSSQAQPLPSWLRAAIKMVGLSGSLRVGCAGMTLDPGIASPFNVIRCGLQARTSDSSHKQAPNLRSLGNSSAMS